jgi:hypothetical protein
MKKSEAEDLLDKAVELHKLVKLSGMTYLPLHSDVSYAIQHWQSNPSQFWSRTAIRCLCAAIEATLFNFRRMAGKMAVVSKVQFDSSEMDILSETQIKNGVARRKFLSPPDAIKESFRLFAKAFGANVIIDYGAGFSAFCAVFEIRNRPMHPKNPFDIEVSTKDIKTAEKGIAWFNKTYVGVIDQCQAHVDQNVANLSKLKS